MGWLDRLFGKKAPAATTAPHRPRVATHPVRTPHFAVIDVETTGLSPRLDRVIELAVVRIDSRGVVVDEWTSRFNPEGPVGATHIHGITDADVARAPLFRDIAPQIIPHIAGLPLAAHNARFDLAFLRSEFRRAGWDVPWLPTYCTLDGSHQHMPHLARRRLIDCCWEAGVRLTDAHSALGDARATAELLSHYMRSDAAARRDQNLTAVHRDAQAVTWPTESTGSPLDPEPTTRRTPATRRPSFPPARAAEPVLIAQLTKLSLMEVLDEGAPVGALTYVETLLDALEDGVLTAKETAALRDLTELYELDSAAIADVHRAFLLALAHRALDDGRVSNDERKQLLAIAELLSVADSVVRGVIADADSARVIRLGAKLRQLPADWTLGEPLRVGEKVAFTGCDGRERDKLERRAQALGVRVMSNVSALTAMLVTDGSLSGTKRAAAAKLRTRMVTPEEFATLLKHLQPSLTAAVPTSKPAAATPTAAPADTPAVKANGTSPGEIRAWGAANGFPVGVRGRLSSELIAAFERAEQTASV